MIFEKVTIINIPSVSGVDQNKAMRYADDGQGNIATS